MSEPLFNIVTFGLTQPGADRNEVATKMAALFKTTPDKLKPYFAGGRKVIKSNVDELVAEKYKVTLEKVGLVVVIEPATAAEAKPAQQEAKPTETQTPGTAKPAATPMPGAAKPAPVDTNGITMAEPGADVLVEKPVIEPQPIGDISDISMAEAGADVYEVPPEKPVADIPDTSTISMADPGAPVYEVPPEKPVADIPDVGDISVAEAGEILAEHVEVEAQPIGDISDISMAEPGADVYEVPPEKPKPKDIDISEIELAN